jgi:hypothetical protein
VLCPDCEGKVERPRNCPTCGLVYEASSVHVLADEDGTTGYTATCPAGHTHSGALPTPAA